MTRRATVVLLAVMFIAVVVTVWLIVPWSADDGGRTDRIIEVYGRQMGLSPDEANLEREHALGAAEFICSIEPGELEERLRSTTTPVAMAIELAEAACPRVAEEFKAAQPNGG